MYSTGRRQLRRSDYHEIRTKEPAFWRDGYRWSQQWRTRSTHGYGFQVSRAIFNTSWRAVRLLPLLILFRWRILGSCNTMRR
jgi:hypothetical protein